LAKLAGGVAVIKVGAATETELKEKKHRIEDALSATRAAVEEGIVPGGGICFLDAASAIDGLSLRGDIQIGARAVRRALEEPFRQMIANAGHDAATALGRLQLLPAGHGIDLTSGETTSMFGAGIVDPARVSRSALQNAASVAALILTTDALIADLPEAYALEPKLAGRPPHFAQPAGFGRGGFVRESLEASHVAIDVDVEEPLEILRTVDQEEDEEETPSGPPRLPPTNGGEGGRPREPGERKIRSWVSETIGKPVQTLACGQKYTLNLQVAEHGQTALRMRGDSVVHAQDVPAGGLVTEWVITSQGIELSANSAHVAIEEHDTAKPMWWAARFQLSIPETGDSEIRQVWIKAGNDAKPAVSLSIFCGNQLYRELEVYLPLQGVGDQASPPSIHQDVAHTPLAQTGLRPSRESYRPAGRLWLVIRPPAIIADGNLGAIRIDTGGEWRVEKDALAGKMENVWKSADDFRVKHSTYLNDIDEGDLSRRLQVGNRGNGWAREEHVADAAHERAWETVATSPELRALAVDGRTLYEYVFPTGSPQGDWMAQLRPGDMLGISWLPWGDGTWVSHVPWGLMYTQALPSAADPIDPMGFLALRQRLSYTSRPTAPASKALGSMRATHREYLMYWGQHPADEIGVESRWQREAWKGWEGDVFVPASAAPGGEREQVLEALEAPTPAPVTVLYVFCQCSVGKGNDPKLCFDSSQTSAATVTRTEMGITKLADRPLVFANGCGTSASDPYFANELQERFFDRGCRAYLGTETRVPPRLASRFASIFFHYLYRKLNSEPIAAGEAVAQTRLFLWREYRNIGGLLYTYVNQYELFVADEDEVASMRD
jgi:hypothetical protein